MDTAQNEQGLSRLMEQVDTLILQHLNYLNKLEDACKKKEQFTHKQPTECNFGKLFYTDVWSSRESFPEEVRTVVVDIEKEHQLFHATAAKINATNPSQQEIDATSACKLILKLYHLEKLVKQHGN